MSILERSTVGVREDIFALEVVVIVSSTLDRIVIKLEGKVQK